MGPRPLAPGGCANKAHAATSPATSTLEFIDTSLESCEATYLIAASIEAFRESGEKFPK
jgi:hypothetical protein